MSFESYMLRNVYYSLAPILVLPYPPIVQMNSFPNSVSANLCVGFDTVVWTTPHLQSQLLFSLLHLIEFEIMLWHWPASLIA